MQSADPLFERPPYGFDRTGVSGARPLLVLFEGADCDECRQLHSQVLSRASVRDPMALFEVVRLNWADSETSLVMPDGIPSTPAAWAEDLGLSRLPAFVFFDEGGSEVFRLESLVLHQRLERALLYVLDRAYGRGLTYQEFTRMKTIERLKADAGAH